MPNSTPFESLKNLIFQGHTAAKDLWISILSSPNCFANPTDGLGFQADVPVDNTVNKSQTWLAELSAGSSWPTHFLPIRTFRAQVVPFIAESAAELTFLSSGTTSGPEGRSRSRFSPDGVALYQRASLWAFADMLQKVSPAQELGGISLVPPVSQWSDSSLARMIHWIGQYWDVTYANYLDLNDVTQAVATASHQGARPVFIFGTAFHLIDFLDQNHRVKLPPGSCVIETGGTKGRTRSVTRSELYQLIACGFGISEDSIVSEYGMCELASQAYDFVPQGKHLNLEERRFRFPWWAPVRAMSEPHEAKKNGVGALLVWDRARIDIPAPIQTEDLIDLKEDGSFQLLGRIPTAPLKGCSLKVDEILHQSPTQAVTENILPVTTKRLATNPLKASAAKVLELLNELVEDSVFAAKLAEELGSKKLADLAVDDLRFGIPVTSDALVEAVHNATQGKNEIAAAWLVIAPSTHSLAAIHSLAILLTCDVKIRLRTSRLWGQQCDSSSLDRLATLIISHGFQVERVPANWKIKSSDDLADESILIFGDDPTIQEIKQISRRPVIGFGNAIAATLADARELSDMSTLDRLVRDNIALAQRGCMSARINFIVGPMAPQIKANLHERFEYYLRSVKDVDIPQQVARSMEVVRLKQLGADVYQTNSKKWLVAITDHLENIGDLVSRQELSFVFCCINQVDANFTNALLKLNALKKLAVSDRLMTDPNLKKLTSIEIVSLGTLNAPKINGVHIKQPILA